MDPENLHLVAEALEPAQAAALAERIGDLKCEGGGGIIRVGLKLFLHCSGLGLRVKGI